MKEPFYFVPLQDAGLYCGPRLRKGEVFAYVWLPQNLKDPKDLLNAFSAVLSTEGRVVGPCWEKLKLQGPKGPPQGSGMCPPRF